MAHANGFTSCFELACTEYDFYYRTHSSKGRTWMVGALGASVIDKKDSLVL